MEFGGSQIGFLIWLLAAVVQTSPAPRNRAQRFAVRRNAGKPGPNPDAVRAGAGEARQIRGNLGYNPFSLPPSLDPRSPPPPPPPSPARFPFPPRTPPHGAEDQGWWIYQHFTSTPTPFSRCTSPLTLTAAKGSTGFGASQATWTDMQRRPPPVPAHTVGESPGDAMSSR